MVSTAKEEFRERSGATGNVQFNLRRENLAVSARFRASLLFPLQLTAASPATRSQRLPPS
jgi:hypothetical protein